MNESFDERFQGANVVDAEKLSPYWGEHTARYSFASQFVNDKCVLDIACGTGYGLIFLKERARQVTGVDASFVAASQAINESNGKAAVVNGNGRCLPFDDEIFDVVTSFETLEHVMERSDFLAELKRVLRKGGYLILSTPNARFTEPVDGVPRNPFHLFEYTAEELRSELMEHFELEKLMGQELNDRFGIPPFYDAQIKLPNDIVTQTRLIGWKIINKLPIFLREGLSGLLWNRPFYPTDEDYVFDVGSTETAPVLVAVCVKS